MLERSRNPPLTVLSDYATCSRYTYVVLLAVLKHLPRIKTLQLCGSHAGWEDIEPILEHPAPLLTDSSMDDLDLPDDLFKGQAPKLTNLILCDCRNWSGQAKVLTNLITFELAPNAPISAEEYIEGLSHLSNVKVLVLSGESFLDNPTSSSSATAHLPALQTLKVSVDILLCALVLNQTSFSSDSNPSITVTCGSIFGLPSTAEEFSHLSDLGIAFQQKSRQLKLPNELTLDFINECLHVSILDTLNIQIETTNMQLIPDILGAFLSRMSLDHLQFLVICQIPMTETDWQRFGILDGLISLGIYDYQSNVETFLKVFSKKAQVQGGCSNTSQAARFLFHGLEGLTLYRWKFALPVVISPPARTTCFQALKATLQARADGCVQLSSLVMCHCSELTDVDIDALRKTVDTLESGVDYGMEAFESDIDD
ncbi:hypothetical protein DXG01_011671 [Tephrocybe rancida]|nr:hypothetical protein DXG01_011671 [Tephrocybe rancida]